MTEIGIRLLATLIVRARGEAGQSLGSFTMILIFAVVAGAIAVILLSGGFFENSPGTEAPNFEPPNPLD